MKYWSLRDELYILFHQWPMMIVFFLAGCLVGWALSLLAPGSYRATSQLYVALNPYRAYSDSNFTALASPEYSNLDDYKNWQMSELESLIFLDEVIEETHSQLSAGDPGWDDFDLSQLRTMLDADWRSAGTWSLVSENPDPELAEDAVKAWTGVALSYVADSTEAALETARVDQQLISAIAEETRMRNQLRRLINVQTELESYSDEASRSDPDQPLDLGERWRLESLVSSAAIFSPGWLDLLGTQPAANDPRFKYLDWIGRALAFTVAEAALIESELNSQVEKIADLEAQYKSTFSASHGLSPNIVVEEIQHLPVKKLRPSSLFTVLGGIIGLLSWILYRLVEITRKNQE